MIRDRIPRVCLALCGGLVVASAAADGIGPSPYLSSADSPFAGIGFAAFYLEDFEDGLVNTPGLGAGAGTVLFPSFQTDSVDADDGSLDGSGADGHSWFSDQVTSNFTFTFDADVLGDYPTHAGLVWTDVGIATTPGFGDVTFEAFGPGGASLGAIDSAALGDGSVHGETAEDRFFGWTDPGGIAQITISMPDSVDWEVDHVQYGIVPEPATMGATLLAVLLLARSARRWV